MNMTKVFKIHPFALKKLLGNLYYGNLHHFFGNKLRFPEQDKVTKCLDFSEE